MFSLSIVAALLFSLLHLSIATPAKRQVPAQPTGVITIRSPNGAEIRYKEPGKDGVCETTPGVNSYSGYISLNATTNMFFWFFEARSNPETAPITLWLNGGPGSDSMIGLFEELGPCHITEDLKSVVNPYSFNEVSNMLFLSQPVGVGFSYGTTKVGYQTLYGAHVEPEPNNATTLPNIGRFSWVNWKRYDTTAIAASATWEILQAFLAELPTLDSAVKNRTFNLWTESYGGHYGPTFYDYFYEQNALIASGKKKGVALQMDTLGIINGVIDELIQVPYYPEFARYNTYGIKAINESVYDFMKFAYYTPLGCRDFIEFCVISDKRTKPGQEVCQIAEILCRIMVEQQYYNFGGRGVYDIRHPYNDPTPPDYFVDYLNQAEVQQALGVAVNYTQLSSAQVGRGFWFTGDDSYRRFMHDLERILNNGVRVALTYGDADYICNWFGGEAVSLALEWKYAKEFRASGYVPFVVDGKEYGEVRQYGQYSFLRMYESGHEVPYYQPKASLELFKRVLGNLIVADGSEPVTPDYETSGKPEATHTESFVPLPSSSSAAPASSAAAF